MKKALFYHAKLSGSGIPSEDLSLAILLEQMAALQRSGLANEAEEIHFGVNRPDALLVATLAPNKTHVHTLGADVEGERPTMQIMQDWLKGHEGWAVCYFHMKGVSHPGDLYSPWRHCMERVIIDNWERCVHLLVEGYDTVGAHWLTPARYPVLAGQRYWGGNFWWAAAKYLAALPPLPPQSGKYYSGEAWIGTGPRSPLVFDFEPHWPMSGCHL